MIIIIKQDLEYRYKVAGECQAFHNQQTGNTWWISLSGSHAEVLIYS